MENNQKISVVLPCYNEKENIIKIVPAIHKELIAYNHEIIVVDDNSPDGTYHAIIQKGYDYVKPILRTVDKGLAKSIRCGIENSSGDIIVVMDSDFNHQPKYLPMMIDNLKYFDCVIASRFLYFADEEHYSYFRIITSWIFNLFIRILLFSKITENLFGFYSIKRDVINRFDFDKIFWGLGDYFIRLVFYLQKEKHPILQIPAVFNERIHGKGNKKLISRIFQYTGEVIMLRLRNSLINK